MNDSNRNLRIGIFRLMQELTALRQGLRNVKTPACAWETSYSASFRAPTRRPPVSCTSVKNAPGKRYPWVAANAISDGPLSRRCFDDICEQVLVLIHGERMDGILLALPGANV